MKPCLHALLLALIIVASHTAEAKRRHRSRSRDPIIVHRILNLKGTATIDGVPAPEFAGIKEGQIVETSANSMVVMRVVGLALVRLGENSQAKLSKFANRDKMKLEILKGDVLVYLRRPGEHQVIAGNQIVSLSREAIVRFRMSSALEADVCACEGKYKLESKYQQVDKPAPSALPITMPSGMPSALSSASPNILLAPVPTPTPSGGSCCKDVDLEVLDSLYKLP